MFVQTIDENLSSTLSVPMVMIIIDEFVLALTYLGVKSLWFRQLRAFWGKLRCRPLVFFLGILMSSKSTKTNCCRKVREVENENYTKYTWNVGPSL